MSALDNCIRRSRRRRVLLLILSQAALAMAVGLAGAILLLLLGTQILNWYWPILLLAGSLAVGLYRIARSLPDSYQITQEVDRRLQLHDTLSTAHHFSKSDTRRDHEMVEAQLASAERVAREVVIAKAIPFRMPAAAYACVGLLLATGTLFGIRYGVRRSMDLSQPLVAFSFDTFRAEEGVASLRKKKTPEQKRLEEQLQGLNVIPDQQDAQQGDLGDAPDSALDTIDTPNVNDFPQEASAKSQRKLSASEMQASGDEEPDENEAGEEGADESASPGGPEGKSPDGAPQAKNASNGDPSENSSLMDKMRDALANLMQKMKVQPKSSSAQQSASSKQGQQANQSKQAMKQQGTPQPGSRQQGDAESSESQGEQEGEGGEKAENAKSRQGAEGSDQQTSKDAKSGTGKQDGNKDVQLAEQLEAMGKISEIFGKRAQNVTGEVMVEVAAGKQQLRTQYSRKSASHSDAGGEIHRDEIPLLYQHYVQQYFEQVRKTAAAEVKNAVTAPAVEPKKP